MNWYYVENGKQIGPVNDGILNRLLKDQTVRPDTLVWRDGMEKWVPYSQMSIGAKTLEAEAATECSECGKRFAPADLATVDGRLVCAACEPAVALNEAHEDHGALNYAGFWIRACAFSIDTFILYSVCVLVDRVFVAIFPDMEHMSHPDQLRIELWFISICLFIQMVYFTFFIGRFGATPGKMTCGLRVVRPDGSPVSYARAFARVFGEMLSRLTFFVGYLIVFFDAEKRALHDRICDTRVIRQ